VYFICLLTFITVAETDRAILSSYATIEQLRRQNTEMRREMDALSRATTKEIALRTAAETAAQDVITALLASPEMMEDDTITPEFVQTLAEAVKTAMFERDAARADLREVGRKGITRFRNK